MNNYHGGGSKAATLLNKRSNAGRVVDDSEDSMDSSDEDNEDVGDDLFDVMDDWEGRERRRRPQVKPFQVRSRTCRQMWK